MCLKTVVDDSTGSVNVTLWDKACYEYFNITVTKLRDLWDEGVDNPENQDEILATLNARASETVVCFCKAEVWQKRVQVNVNQLEIVESEDNE